MATGAIKSHQPAKRSNQGNRLRTLRIGCNGVKRSDCAQLEHSIELGRIERVPSLPTFIQKVRGARLQSSFSNPAPFPTPATLTASHVIGSSVKKPLLLRNHLQWARRVPCLFHRFQVPKSVVLPQTQAKVKRFLTLKLSDLCVQAFAFLDFYNNCEPKVVGKARKRSAAFFVFEFKWWAVE